MRRVSEARPIDGLMGGARALRSPNMTDLGVTADGALRLLLADTVALEIVGFM